LKSRLNHKEGLKENMNFNKIIIFIFSIITIISAQDQIPTKIDSVIFKDSTIIFLDKNTGFEYEVTKEKILTNLLPNSKHCSLGVLLPIAKEFGGNVSFSHTEFDGGYKTILDIEPLFLKYYYETFIGPILGVRMEWYQYKDYDWTFFDFKTQFLLGFHGGVLLRDANHALRPYIDAGISGFYTIDHDLFINNFGISIPFVIGLKNRISSSSAVNYGLFYNYSRINSRNITMLGISVGLSFCRQ